MRGVLGEVLLTKSSRLEVLDGQGRLIIRKTGFARGIGDLRAQIRALQTLPEALLQHYPQLLRADSQEPPAWYEMPFYAFASLRDLVFELPVAPEGVETRLNHVIRFLFGCLYSWRTGPATEDYVERAYSGRMRNRIREIRERDPELNMALGAREVWVDGRSHENAETQLERILQKCGRRLLPPRLCSTHGQLEFDHILFDLGEVQCKVFILLDTSGVDTLADPAYDVGKIRQCLCAKVDLLKQDLFELHYEVRRNTLAVESFITLNARLSVADRLSSYMNRQIRDAAKETGDPELEMRSHFAEAVHLCSSLPYYYEPTEAGRKRTLALYVQGVRAFSSFSERFLSRREL